MGLLGCEIGCSGWRTDGVDQRPRSRDAGATAAADEWRVEVSAVDVGVKSVMVLVALWISWRC